MQRSYNPLSMDINHLLRECSDTVLDKSSHHATNGSLVPPQADSHPGSHVAMVVSKESKCVTGKNQSQCDCHGNQIEKTPHRMLSSSSTTEELAKQVHPAIPVEQATSTQSKTVALSSSLEMDVIKTELAHLQMRVTISYCMG